MRTDFESLQDYAEFVGSRTKQLGDKTLRIHHATTGMATEAGEALDTSKKMWIYEQPLDTLRKDGQTHQGNLIEEAGDCLFYIQALCNELGVSLLDVMAENMNKLLMRYPTGYSNEAAKERADKSD